MLSDNNIILNNKDLLYINKNPENKYIRIVYLYFPVAINKPIAIDTNELKNYMLYISKNSEIYLKNIKYNKKIPKYNLYLTSSSLIILMPYLRNSKTQDILYEIYSVTQTYIYINFYISTQYLDYITNNYIYINGPLESLITLDLNKFTYFQCIDNIDWCSILEPAQNEIYDEDHSIYKFTKYLKKKPYNYQYNNVSWMISTENNIDLKLHTYDFFNKSTLSIYTLNNIKYYYDKNNHILYSEQSLNNYKIFYKKFIFNGGVLCDEVGIGKTLSSIYLIIYTLKNNVISYPDNLDEDDLLSYKANNITIVICPKRLVQHWSDEFKKFIKEDKINVYEFHTIVDTVLNKNRTLKKILNNDVLIIPMSLLSNDKYVQEIEANNNEYFNILKYRYKRIILDEGHEILFPNHKLKADRMAANFIYNITASYKWVLSGTPFAKGSSNLNGILSYLLNYDITDLNMSTKEFNKLSNTDARLIIEQLCRRNTEISIKQQIFIPKIIKKTKFLNMNILEQSLYKNAQHLKDEKLMLQLCSNIYVNDNISNLLGNRKLNLEQINSEMIKHFRSKNIEYKNNLCELAEKLIKEETENTPIIKKLGLQINELKNIKDKTDEENETLKKLREEKKKLKQHLNYEINHAKERTEFYENEIKYNESQIEHYDNINNYVEIFNSDPDKICPILGTKIKDCIFDSEGNYYSKEGIDMLLLYKRKNNKDYIKSPFTGENIFYKDLIYYDAANTDKSTDSIEDINKNKWGTKMYFMVKSIDKILKKNNINKIIIFSQWKKTLNIIQDILEEVHINYVSCVGNIYVISKSISKFKNDIDTKVILLCSENCSSGINLIEATHVIFIDTLNSNILNVKAIQEQAIARAVRLGQKNNVKVYNE